jgi:ferredoxin
VRDGEVLTACAQACPTSAIHFGNLADPHSTVAKMWMAQQVELRLYPQKKDEQREKDENARRERETLRGYRILEELRTYPVRRVSRTHSIFGSIWQALSHDATRMTKQEIAAEPRFVPSPRTSIRYRLGEINGDVLRSLERPRPLFWVIFFGSLGLFLWGVYCESINTTPAWASPT